MKYLGSEAIKACRETKQGLKNIGYLNFIERTIKKISNYPIYAVAMFKISKKRKTHLCKLESLIYCYIGIDPVSNRSNKKFHYSCASMYHSRYVYLY